MGVSQEGGAGQKDVGCDDLGNERIQSGEREYLA